VRTLGGVPGGGKAVSGTGAGQGVSEDALKAGNGE
jgi:hypothetical protein